MATAIVALDVPSMADARRIIDLLGDQCRYYKVGGELFTAEGPAVVAMVRDAGCEVFLDLKFHDIPNTVRASVRSAARLGASLVTVHASGGSEMIGAAVEGAGSACGVLAVTVLTSHTAASIGHAWGREGVVVGEEVLRLADLAADAGATGLVCGGQEATGVRARHGDSLKILVPGIRLGGGAAHDQARPVTPADAVRAGATYLVLGRAVTASSDPMATMAQVRRELGQHG